MPRERVPLDRSWMGEHRELIEILEAVVLAFVAVATAWSGYQAAIWDGRQAHLYGLSSKYRLVATQSSSLAGQERLFDTTTFSFWLQAHASGNRTEQRAFEARFRPEFRPAFAAWLKTEPFTNGDAPAGPLLMPEYVNTASHRAAAYEARASSAFDAGTAARRNGDRYVRATVLLATVLFVTAIAQRFTIRRVRIALGVLAAVVLVFALVLVGTYPVA
jgi:hypothetical protein